MEENTRYKTTSLDLAAYLLTTGAKLESIEGGSPDSTFCFTSITHEVLSAYWTGEAKVSPQAVLQAYKHLAHRAREASIARAGRRVR